ncbi:hypothetical protein QEN19_002199 [Hanseniaspora menglaensis]
MSTFRHLLVTLHSKKSFSFQKRVINAKSCVPDVLSDFTSSIILYIDQLRTQNSEFRTPKKHNIIYIPSRYLSVYVFSNTSAINSINFFGLESYFLSMGYNKINFNNFKNVDKYCMCLTFECQMNLSANINTFKKQTEEIDSHKQLKFVELSDLKINMSLNFLQKECPRYYLEEGINELFSNYINSLIISILEPNYPIVFNKETRELLQLHISSIPHLTSLQIPISFIFKILSFDSMHETTSFTKLLNGKCQNLPVNNYNNLPS